jgi:integrase
MAVWKLPKLPSGRNRNKPYRAKIKGRVKDFPDRKTAEYWATQQLVSYATTGLPLTIEALEKVTVGEIVRRYLEEKTPLKGSAASEILVLKRFLRHPICNLTLAAIKRRDAFGYRNERLKDTWNGKPIAESSVKREFAILRNIFEVAREEWGFENLANPFDKMKLKDGHGRNRRLKKGELEKIEQACEACRGLNPYYIPLAAYLAIETGMRTQEIFNLLWSDIDVPNRRIVIRKSKTDHVSQLKGRTIVLTVNALWYTLRLALLSFGPLEKVVPGVSPEHANKAYWNAISAKDERIFPMTKEAFKQAWRDVTKIRAKIPDLQFRDLRHEAGSRFDEAGLTKAEHDLMLGHGKRTMRDRYIHAELQSVQDKLDRFERGGLTPKERRQKMEAEAIRNPDGSFSMTTYLFGDMARDAARLLNEGVPVGADVIPLDTDVA